MRRAWDANTSAAQVRTQTLVKNAIIQIDATPFKQWYQTHYGVELGTKGKVVEVEAKKVRAVGGWLHASHLGMLREQCNDMHANSP